jgi:hypothetical protein
VGPGGGQVVGPGRGQGGRGPHETPERIGDDLHVDIVTSVLAGLSGLLVGDPVDGISVPSRIAYARCRMCRMAVSRSSAARKRITIAPAAAQLSEQSEHQAASGVGVSPPGMQAWCRIGMTSVRHEVRRDSDRAEDQA